MAGGARPTSPGSPSAIFPSRLGNRVVQAGTTIELGPRLLAGPADTVGVVCVANRDRSRGARRTTATQSAANHSSRRLWRYFGSQTRELLNFKVDSRAFPRRARREVDAPRPGVGATSRGAAVASETDARGASRGRRGCWGAGRGAKAFPEGGKKGQRLAPFRFCVYLRLLLRAWRGVHRAPRPARRAAVSIAGGTKVPGGGTGGAVQWRLRV